MSTKEPLFRMAPFVKGSRHAANTPREVVNITPSRRRVSAADLVDAASTPSPPQEFEIGMPYTRPQAADIVEAALSVAPEVVLAPLNRGEDVSTEGCVAEVCTPWDPEAELRTVVERWPNLPRELQVAIMDIVSTAGSDPV